MESKHRKSARHGFSLIEMLVVLVIIVAIAKAVAPNLTPNQDANAVKLSVKSLAHQLQLSIDESKWLRLNHAVHLDGKDLIILVQRDGKWQTAKTLSMNADINIKTDKHALSKAAAIIQADQSFNLLFFSSGEYTPFELTLIAGRNQQSLKGDGFNAIQFK